MFYFFHFSSVKHVIMVFVMLSVNIISKSCLFSICVVGDMSVKSLTLTLCIGSGVKAEEWGTFLHCKNQVEA